MLRRTDNEEIKWYDWHGIWNEILEEKQIEDQSGRYCHHGCERFTFWTTRGKAYATKKLLKLQVWVQMIKLARAPWDQILQVKIVSESLNIYIYFSVYVCDARPVHLVETNRVVLAVPMKSERTLPFLYLPASSRFSSFEITPISREIQIALQYSIDIFVGSCIHHWISKHTNCWNYLFHF